MRQISAKRNATTKVSNKEIYRFARLEKRIDRYGCKSRISMARFIVLSSLRYVITTRARTSQVSDQSRYFNDVYPFPRAVACT